MNRIRIAVFEKMPLLRAGIAHVLSTAPAMVLAAEGGSLSEALHTAALKSADVVLIDVNLLQRADAAHELTVLCSNVRVILMILPGNEGAVRAALSAGVLGCILKGSEKQELVEAVRAVSRGEGYVSPALAALILRDQAPAVQERAGWNAKPPTLLTHREEQIFKLLCGGLRNREIGMRLHLSEKSVKRYVTRVFEKLNVRNRVEAVMAAQRGCAPTGTEPRPGHTEIAQSPAVLLAGRRGTQSGLAKAQAYRVLRELPEREQPDPASARCFRMVFARSELVVDSARRAPDGMPWGTHILLRR